MTRDPIDRLAAAYAGFADDAHGRSPLYEQLCREVARDRELLAILAGLPLPKQQPSLLLGAVKLLFGVAPDWPQFRAWVFSRLEEVLALIRTRSTQTNEPARCATLLPLLATLPPPLALLEVGASAGLCLLPDRYGYDYGRVRIDGTPTFACRASAATPLPTRPLEVAWRAGLDLAPVDIHDPDQLAWLEALVWPGEGTRPQTLRAALEVARADPPRVIEGDLRTDLPALAADAPRDATLVVFHTAVLAYVADAGERAAFAATVRELGAVWVANEHSGLVTAHAPPTSDPWPSGRFLLTHDGEPVAWTDPHGAAIDWLG
jgi:hypothetical protein